MRATVSFPAGEASMARTANKREEVVNTGRVVTGVTIETFDDMIGQMGIQSGQEFTVIVESAAEARARAFCELQALAETVRARTAADGLTSDDVLEILEAEDEAKRQCRTG